MLTTFLNRNLLIVLYKAVVCKKLSIIAGTIPPATTFGGTIDLETHVQWYQENWKCLQNLKQSNAEALEVKNNPGHAWRAGEPLESEESRGKLAMYPGGEYGKAVPVVMKSGRRNTGLSK